MSPWVAPVARVEDRHRNRRELLAALVVRVRHDQVGVTADGGIREALA
jgi:hypothetical protein